MWFLITNQLYYIYKCHFSGLTHFIPLLFYIFWYVLFTGNFLVIPQQPWYLYAECTAPHTCWVKPPKKHYIMSGNENPFPKGLQSYYGPVLFLPFHTFKHYFASPKPHPKKIVFLLKIIKREKFRPLTMRAKGAKITWANISLYAVVHYNCVCFNHSVLYNRCLLK